MFGDVKGTLCGRLLTPPLFFARRKNLEKKTMKHKKLLLLSVFASVIAGAALFAACSAPGGETDNPPAPHVHNYVATEVKDCVRGDYTLYECSCGANYKVESGAAVQGHTMVNDECTRCHAKATAGLAISVSGGAATVTGLGTVSGDEIIIPATYNGVPVTAIGKDAFKSVSSVKYLTVPTSVATIAESSFYDCDGLKEVRLPSGLKSIGERAFGACDNLERVILPETLKTLGAFSFSSCPALASFAIPASVESIGVGFLSYNGAVKTVSVASDNSFYKAVNNCVVETFSGKLLGAGNGAKIPDDGSVTEICDAAFSCLTGMGEQVLPESVKVLGEKIFAYSDITGLTINGNVTDFDVNILKNCQNLSKLNASGLNYKYDGVHNCIIDTENKVLVKGCATSVIPDDGSVTEIGERAFKDCAALTAITIPNSITKIGNYAFADTGLTEITLPSSLTATATGNMDSAFQNCTNLKSVVIEEGVKVIGQFMFSGCSKLTQIVLPDSVTAIGNSAFMYCFSLSKITLGKNLSSIGSGAFTGCNYLYECYNLSSSLTVTAGNSDKTVNGGLDGVVKYLHTDKNEASKLIAVGKFVFVNEDGGYALIGYTGDSQDLILPTDCNGSSYVIPDRAFADSAYKSLTINGGVTAIGAQAFSRSKFESVIIRAGTLEIGKSAFSGCSSAKTLTILADSLTLADNYSIRMVNLTELTLSSTTLSTQYFRGFSELEKVTLSNVDIGSYCFMECPALNEITINSGSIGKQAFMSCTALNKVTIKSEVASIGEWAFYQCGLAEVVLENKEWTITYDGQSYDITVEIGQEAKCLNDYSGYFWTKKQ